MSRSPFPHGPSLRRSAARTLAGSVFIALAACSRAPEQARVDRAAAEEAKVAAPAAPAAAELARVVAPVVPPPPPVAPPAAREQLPAPNPGSEAETRQIAEDLYRGMDPRIPEKDRREVARTMAEDLQQMGRESKADQAQNGAERARRERQGDLDRTRILQQECADLRMTLAVLERIVRDGPPRGERRTVQEMAAIPGEIAAIQTRLAQLCP